jgi:hypothetical protein
MLLAPTALPTSWLGTSPKFDMKSLFANQTIDIEFGGGREGAMSRQL